MKVSWMISICPLSLLCQMPSLKLGQRRGCQVKTFQVKSNPLAEIFTMICEEGLIWYRWQNFLLTFYLLITENTEFLITQDDFLVILKMLQDELLTLKSTPNVCFLFLCINFMTYINITIAKHFIIHFFSYLFLGKMIQASDNTFNGVV